MKQSGRGKVETYEDKTDRGETWREYEYEARWTCKDGDLRGQD
jgi:hypothetical protein